jgi:hypothetical protein
VTWLLSHFSILDIPGKTRTTSIKRFLRYHRSSNTTKIDLAAYKNWLNEIKIENENNLLRSTSRCVSRRRTRRICRDTKMKRLRSLYNVYITNIIKLRYDIEVLKQNRYHFD